MGSFSLRLLLIPLLGIFMLGASCNAGQEPVTATADGKPVPAGSSLVESLPEVDTSALTEGERRIWIDLVNAQLSPCGEPVSVAKCVSEKRACGACVPAARYASRLVSEGFEKGEIMEMLSDRYDPKRKLSIDVSQAPIKGAPMAKVTIVEFSDFKCPHCAAANPVLGRLVDEFQGKVAVAFKNFPLDGHAQAKPAARAAYAAHQQNKFWPMVDLLFDHQRELSDEKFREFAQTIGLEMGKFEADFASDASLAHVEADRKQGDALNIDHTPTIYVNSRPYNGSVQNLSKYIKEELETP
jgi:protein-disulfide isomerase